MSEAPTIHPTADDLLAPPVNPVARTPLNFDAVDKWPAEVSMQVKWLHRHVQEHNLTYGDIQKAIGYSASTVCRLFNGGYNGNLSSVANEIRGFRQIVESRENVHDFALVRTAQARLIQTTLDFCLSNGAIVELIGESGMGKTWVSLAWIKAKGYDSRVIYIHAPPVVHRRTIPELLARALGLSPSKHSADELMDKICRSLSRERAIIVDEAVRLLPTRPGSVPFGLEYLRDIHDRTGCGIALLATDRLPDVIRSDTKGFMYEQWVGRTDLSVKLPRQFSRAAVRQLLAQFWHNPSDKLLDTACSLVATLRHLRELKRVVTMAQRIARKGNKELEENHFNDAMTLLSKMTTGKIGEDEA